MSKKKVSKKAAVSLTTEVLIHRIEMLEKLVVGKDAVLSRIDILRSDVDRIDKRVVIISDGLRFMADNCRQMFGLSGLAQILDAITAKFK